MSSTDYSKFTDPEGMKQLAELRDRIADRWLPGTSDVLRSRNPELLDKIKNVESRLNSLLVIADKPKELRTKLKDTLDDYERVCNQAIAYAARHLTTDAVA